MTPPPEIVSAKPGDCGRSIEVKWNSRYDGHELQLDSTSDRKIQAYNTSHLSLSGPHLHVFYGLISNTIYEVRIRARTFNGFGLWAKREIRTTAGIVIMWYNYCLFMFFLYLFLFLFIVKFMTLISFQVSYLLEIVTEKRLNSLTFLSLYKHQSLSTFLSILSTFDKLKLIQSLR